MLVDANANRKPVDYYLIKMHMWAYYSWFATTTIIYTVFSLYITTLITVYTFNLFIL